MHQLLSAIDEYLSNTIDNGDNEEKEELILRDLCMICDCNLDSDVYEDGLFYDEMRIAHHLVCKCKLHAHQTCIDNYIKCESQCPKCEKPIEKAPFLKKLWVFFVLFFEQIH